MAPERRREERSTDGPLAIRPANDGDSGGVCALLEAVFAEHDGVYFFLDEMPELEAVASSFASAGGAFWVAERDGTIVGCVGFTPAKDPGGLELKKLYVARSERRSGLGSRLVALVETEARKRHAAFIDLWSDAKFLTAHRFYARRGYLPTTTTRDLHDRSATVEHHFRKPLPP